MLAALSPAERQDLIMSVGVHVKRRRAKPMRLAGLIDKALATDSLDEIADHVNLRDTTILRKLRSLKDLPEEVQNLVDWGTSNSGLSFSVAAEIARCADALDRRKLAQLALEHHLRKDDVQAIVQRASRAGCSVEDAAEEILKLRPDVEQQFLYVGMLDGRVSDDVARRNIRRNLAKLVGAENVLAVRCGDGRFSVVLNSAGAESKNARQRLSSGKLQSFINEIAAS
ncbi:MAG: hypothetical protein F4220_14540 [Gammaproteobacteria bacterium]|nr:hypothetical protein [Gammaproteobacteria bacterium]